VPERKPVYCVWQDETGRRWLAHRFGDPLFEDGTLHPDVIKEQIGVPAGWREAAEQLPQDCGCIVHKGPCWLANDFDWRERNAKLVWPATVYPPGLGPSPMKAYSQEEATRLHELGNEMERRGITSLLTFLRVTP
jgi:hypothetical protein